MSEEEANLEQERLLNKARAKTQNVTFTIDQDTNQALSFTSFKRPIEDLKLLPDGHWKWPCLYSRLGLPIKASKILVKKHYRQLSLLYHPDKNIGKGNSLPKFLAIKEAYEKICNHDR